MESSEHVCTGDSVVVWSRKSDHIARFIPTATKTVGDNHDLVLFTWPSEISKYVVCALMYGVETIRITIKNVYVEN